MEVKTTKITQDQSYVPFQITLATADEKKLATGTAFFYEMEGTSFLITNWHNVSGKHPHDFSFLHKNSIALPQKMGIQVPFQTDAGEGKLLLQWRELWVPLYEDIGNDAPAKARWYVHPEHGPNVDVVAFMISHEGSAAIPANNARLKLANLQVRAGMDAFVLGFPVGMSGGGKFPLWKRASVASEPDIDVGELPLFYIDTATKQGMSGSPVYVQDSGMWIEEGKKFPDEANLGTGIRFVGIYSGRLDGTEFVAQIGKVWKERAIRQIIEGKCVGKSSFDYYAKT